MMRDRGRPRSFDVDAALDAALPVFWRHGFLDASLSDLTATMGLSKPSLYAAFGDKAALYLKALDRYISMWLAPHIQILDEEPDAYSAVERLLISLASMLSNPALPGGCFIVNGSADCGAQGLPQAVDAALRAALHASEIKLKARLTRAQAEGDLPHDANADELAGLFSALLAGLAVQGRAGASTKRLHQLIGIAMHAWPRAEAG